MRSVAILAIAGLVALVIARLAGSTPLAVLAVAMAITGIVLLLRDWRSERRATPPDPEPGPTEPRADATDDAQHELSPDEFSPDISTDPNGPSSNARAD